MSDAPLPVPPPVLTGLYVVVYAHVDDAVPFEQRRTLSVDGQWLGRVPCVAICQDFDTREYAVQYCDAAWELLAISGGHASVDAAKARVEHSYPGLMSRWVDAALSFEAALAIHEAERRRGACSFCGQVPFQVSMMFGDEDEGTRICSDCVAQFHDRLHAEDAEPPADEVPPWLQQLTALGQRQGFLTHAQINDRLPSTVVDPEKIEAIVDILTGSGIRVLPHAP